MLERKREPVCKHSLAFVAGSGSQRHEVADDGLAGLVSPHLFSRVSEIWACGANGI